MTVEEFAARTGMSARNIRALQSRGLLPPPLRRGRRAFYLEHHVHRAEAIKDLQRQGFNLFAIGSILGTGDDPQAAEMAALLERVGAREPSLLATLQHHGIVTRTDGLLRVIRPKPIRVALTLRQLGIPVPAAIRMVADILDATEPAAGDLLHMVHADIVENWDHNLGPSLNANPVTRAQAVITLLSETTRVVLENVGSELMRGVLDPAPPR